MKTTRFILALIVGSFALVATAPDSLAQRRPGSGQQLLPPPPPPPAPDPVVSPT